MTAVERVAELVAVHDVPRGSMIVLKGVEIEDVTDWDVVAKVVGHTQFVVCVLPDDASMEVVDAEQFLADLHEQLRSVI